MWRDSLSRTCVLVGLEILKDLAGLFRPLATVLQGVEVENNDCRCMMTDLLAVLDKRRQNSEAHFAELFSSATSAAVQLDVELTTPRIPGGFNRKLSCEAYCRVNGYNVALDVLRTDLRERLATLPEHVDTIATLLPAAVVKTAPKFSDFKPVLNAYKDVLAANDVSVSDLGFKNELALWTQLWEAKQADSVAAAAVDGKDPDPLPSMAAEALPKADGFKCINVLLSVLCVLPVSSCTAERVFSKVNTTLSSLRSTMCQDRLESLILIRSNRGRLPKTADVLKRFSGRPSRRCHF